ncbi:LysR substrate-binding domain-containing protein [Mesobacterium sp. TK19101]|uniref:LysR substrate-binding domain-containing protein n=1 Tax=Mesobacterium hydrothermale TaxID=3111907 RepID=A0ABU6HDA0_9RHOB|nr:LysR substrate-binding domain-containing protein [Mesobacterium sp. TK19101]MEC3860429.1 LysR substrate-binding domain-containing protein [Mesobacterium sp. TK19101]
MKKPTPPPLHFIRSFEVAARHLSFTRAAEELGYTQAAISTHIRALEHYVGRALFTRGARSLHLTEIGEAFLPSLRQALQQIDDATDAIVKSSREESVVLACPTSLAESWVPGVLARFRETHPQVEVLLHGTVWERADRDIADIVIAIHREDEVPPGCRQLLPETLALVCAPDLAKRITRPADLVGMPQISVAGRQETMTAMLEAMDQPPFDPPPGTLRTNGSNTALELAAQGLGVAVVLSSLAGRYLRDGRLAEPFDVRPDSPWKYYLSSAPRLSRAAAALVDCLMHGV